MIRVERVMPRWISFFFLALISVLTQAEIYKWKDANGKVHFSDRDPKQSAEEVILGPDVSEEKRERARKKAKEFIERQQRKSAFQAEEAGKIKKREREEKVNLAKKKNYCAKAKRELKILKMGVPVYRADKSGERSYLDDAKREAEINAWRQNIRQYCE